MLRNTLSCAVLGLPTAVFAGYSPMTDAQSGHALVVGLDTGLGYDDNIYGAATDEVDSFTAFAAPYLTGVKALGDQGQASLGYQLNARWYENREPDDLLFNHAFQGLVAYKPTERLDISVSDQLRLQDDPETSLTFDDQSLRADQSYWDNDLRARVLGFVTERFGLGVNGRLYGLNYDNADLAEALDRIDKVGGVEGRYRATERLDVVIEGQYQKVHYDKDTDIKGSHSWLVFGGVDYALQEKLRVEGRAGWELRDRNSGDDDTLPYFSGAVRWHYSETSSLRGYVSHRYTEISDPYRYNDARTLSAGVDWLQDLTGRDRLFLSIGASEDFSILQGRGGFDDVKEDALRAGIALEYKPSKSLRFRAGYDLDLVSSEDDDREQTRNRVSLSAGYSFGAY